MLFLLLTLSALAQVPTRDPLPRDGGKALYDSNCWQCHGERALGDGPLSASIPSPSLAGRITEVDHDRLLPIILHGAGDMPGYAPVLTKEESRWILIWLATLDPVTGLGPAPDADEGEPESEPEAVSPAPASASPPPAAEPPTD